MAHLPLWSFRLTIASGAREERITGGREAMALASASLNPIPSLGSFHCSRGVNSRHPFPFSSPKPTATIGTGTRAPRLAPSAQRESDQLDLSVLRFTLGIPGLDESYLPRYIGLAFGSLLLLNHFAGASGPPTPAQLRSEALGICLSAFSVALPYLGKFLKGSNLVDRSILPEGNKQVFVMSEDLIDILKEDLAWGSFVLLRNTNTMSVILYLQDTLCIRGYWNVPKGATKSDTLNWFKREIQDIGLENLSEELYFPQSTGQLWRILPNGAASILVQPLHRASDQSTKDRADGFVFLVSSASYAYREKDRAWIKAIANKFKRVL